MITRVMAIQPVQRIDLKYRDNDRRQNGMAGKRKPSDSFKDVLSKSAARKPSVTS